MTSHTEPDVATHITEKAESLAGITSTASLQNSSSYEIYGKVEWPQGAKSVLVLALAHKESEPELDSSPFAVSCWKGRYIPQRCRCTIGTEYHRHE